MPIPILCGEHVQGSYRENENQETKGGQEQSLSLWKWKKIQKLLYEPDTQTNDP